MIVEDNFESEGVGLANYYGLTLARCFQHSELCTDVDHEPGVSIDSFVLAGAENPVFIGNIKHNFRILLQVMAHYSHLSKVKSLANAQHYGRGGLINLNSLKFINSDPSIGLIFQRIYVLEPMCRQLINDTLRCHNDHFTLLVLDLLVELLRQHISSIITHIQREQLLKFQIRICFKFISEVLEQLFVELFPAEHSIVRQEEKFRVLILHNLIECLKST